MLNEANFREILLPSSTRLREKYLSNRSLLKHTSSWRDKLPRFAYVGQKIEILYRDCTVKPLATFISTLPKCAISLYYMDSFPLVGPVEKTTRATDSNALF